ncbi:PAS domain-containing protein [Nostoc sp.]|uniref:PAS domain-containing protein n=1 Tax=Nostoc sp. TaxID=1180 RepID=UPI002FF9CE57
MANEKLLHRQVSKKANYSPVARNEEGMVLQLADGTIQACSTTCDRILGLRAEQLVGQNLLAPRWHFFMKMALVLEVKFTQRSLPRIHVNLA